MLTHMDTLYSKNLIKQLPAFDGKRFRFEHFTLSKSFVERERLSGLFGGIGSEVYGLEPGTYIKLIDKDSKQIVMSDTWMEKQTNSSFVRCAKGDVLIGGLGIGMILLAIQKKKEVKAITVVEKYSEIANHIVKNLKLNKKVKIVVADIFEYVPDKKFDTIYFDIWNSITGDNWEEMKLLRRRYKKYLKDEGWINSWRSDDCKELKYEDNKIYG